MTISWSPDYVSSTSVGLVPADPKNYVGVSRSSQQLLVHDHQLLIALLKICREHEAVIGNLPPHISDAIKSCKDIGVK
jgi:hypothetical protein